MWFFTWGIILWCSLLAEALFLVFADGRKETSAMDQKWLYWTCSGLATEPSHVMIVTRDETKTFHSNKHRQSEIYTLFIGWAIRPTSSLRNVISPQQFQSTDCPSLKRTSWIGCFPRFLDCGKALRHFWAPSVYRRCRTAPAPFKQLSAWVFDRTHVGQLWVRLAVKQPQQVS